MNEYILSYIISGIAGIALFFLRGILVEIKSLRSDITKVIISQTADRMKINYIENEVKTINERCKMLHPIIK